ncbi:uncharacterized protein V6R79_018978 [Siganus canaliculatus]
MTGKEMERRQNKIKRCNSGVWQLLQRERGGGDYGKKLERGWLRRRVLHHRQAEADKSGLKIHSERPLLLLPDLMQIGDENKILVN